MLVKIGPRSLGLPATLLVFVLSHVVAANRGTLLRDMLWTLFEAQYGMNVTYLIKGLAIELSSLFVRKRYVYPYAKQKSPAAGSRAPEILLKLFDQPSKNSFMRAKKPVDSGLFSFDDSSSNSCSSSRWRLESFCGVSIWIWM
jgi:hypothetical protein